MGKIRVAALGDVSEEKEAKRRAEARRQTKDSKKPSGKTQGKGKVEGVGLKGGQRVAVVEGTEINPEYKKLIEEVEQSEKPEETEKKKVKKEKKARIRGKKYSHMSSLVDRSKLYPTAEAVALVKKTSFTKFDGTVELHINLNPLTLGDKKDLRGSVHSPMERAKKSR